MDSRLRGNDRYKYLNVFRKNKAPIMNPNLKYQKSLLILLLVSTFAAAQTPSRLNKTLATKPPALKTATASSPLGLAAGTADYIVAVVNQELVTNAELQQRLGRIRDEAARDKTTALPPDDELRQKVLEAMIDERVQITNARDTGPRVDDVEIERAVANVAAQNQVTPQQLREKLQQQGVSYSSFRNNIKDQILLERVREREVNARIRIGSDEVDTLLEQRRAQAGGEAQINLAQILVTVPEGAALL
jgi:peptidyl-prolyl cis-trans isomerase SurA